MTGLYIHIPFCASRCVYCGFYSTTLPALRDAYVDALCQELPLRAEELPADEAITTIYLGGGTPSQLTTDQLDRLFSYIYKVYRPQPVEVTMECNPDDVTPAFADWIAQSPIDRISMGAQTFSDDRLRLLRRRHTAAEVRRATTLLRQAGIRNISIDLMFGFPGETLADWEQDIDEALRLGVEHISAYSLMYEEGTTLHRWLSEGRIQEIDDDLSLRMYDCWWTDLLLPATATTRSATLPCPSARAATTVATGATCPIWAWEPLPTPSTDGSGHGMWQTSKPISLPSVVVNGPVRWRPSIPTPIMRTWC